jgi:TonB family protein
VALAPAALNLRAQQPPPPTQPAPAPPPAAARPAPAPAGAAEITEDQLRKLLVGRDLFLRGGYLDDNLEFNERGILIGHSPQGSFTLCGLRINRVRLLRHKIELLGDRYALQFLGVSPGQDPAQAVSRVNITPRKKELRITIDRELLVKARSPRDKGKPAPPPLKPAPAAAPAVASPTPAAATQAPAAPAPAEEPSDAAQAQAEIAQAPAAERPADLSSVTTTHSPAHASQTLLDALGNVFAQGFDARMMASLPAFWKLYYQAADQNTDYQPADPNILRQNTVDKKARLLTAFDPGSNQFAQAFGVAGAAEYRVVVGVDGKPQQIAVARPIGFGLDENALAAIRKASFEPALKDGHPVPVLIDMVVEFRIYSNRTAANPQPAPNQPPEAPILPGPYSLQH